MKQHTVVLTFNERGDVIPINGHQTAEELKVKLGDRLRWTTPHGTVVIEFPDSSPFEGGDSKGYDEFRAIIARGEFQYSCGITTSDGNKHGWKANGGGTVIVGGGSIRSKPGR